MSGWSVSIYNRFHSVYPLLEKQEENSMNRRGFHRLLLGTLASAGAAALARQSSEATQKFLPNWFTLQQHSLPPWFDDAKLGIFIHWGLYSVPAWAPLSGDITKIAGGNPFGNNPYAEWYLNSLRIDGSPTQKHHLETYGKDFDYYKFIGIFNEKNKNWRPDDWASTFRQAGAQYVVLTTKHHDGFRLWPSEVVNPHADGRDLNPRRDLVGDLTAAVRGAGLKMGLYYSGGLDWTFTSAPIQSMSDLMARVPQSEEYARYADAHWNELIRRYQPSILWNDISYPKAGHVAEIFSTYYNRLPQGVVNNRFDAPFSDFTTPEYAKYDKITEKKWESCRGLGFSFGYNQQEGPEQVIAPDKLVQLFVDIVSKNGNLLLNIGPKADGTIPDIQQDRLRKLGEWMAVNGEGIHGSRSWVRPAATAADGTEVRFTKKGDSVYAFFLNRPEGNRLTLPGIQSVEGTQVAVLGSDLKTSYKQQGTDVVVDVAGKLPESYALGVKITPTPWQLVKS
jgi:alpha-L-fucosidase